MTPSATGSVARQIVSTRDLESSVVSGRHVLTQTHSFHHRLLRSHGLVDTPDNLVLLSGTGTTGDHGWVHAHVKLAKCLGLIVPSWAEPADWPIYRRDPYGVGWDWFLQGTDGQLTWCADGADRISALLGEQIDFTHVLAQYRQLVRSERGAA